ncbi:MAG: phosphoribosylformylglycinamidine synthase, partial [Chloroflexi bacterium]|nr:phosphoribosylformylglycinamidine synthase [Chloroflexota bacterium]
MHRIEVRLKNHLPDAQGLGLVKDIHDLGITKVSDVRVVDVYWLDADLSPNKLDLICHSLLADPVTQEYQTKLPKAQGDVVDLHTVEVIYNAGVTDPVEASIMKALNDLGVGEVKAVKTAKRYLIKGRLDEDELQTICNRLLVNPIIQHIADPEKFRFPENPQYTFKLNHVDILGLDTAGLSKVRQQFGFFSEEFDAIVAYYRQQGRNPTDAELETLAQTWSEHCVHKTFKAKIKFGSQIINNL